MLTLDDHIMYERICLGTFVEFPLLCKANYKLLNISCFSDEYRQQLFNNILSEAKQGRVITNESVFSGMMETDLHKHEMTKIISSSNANNLLSSIDALLTDEALNKFYRLGQRVQDMVTNDSDVFEVERYITNTTANLMPEDHDEFTSSLKNTISEIKSGVIHNEKYPIDIERWDKYVAVTPRSIFTIAGNEGTFKTKFMIWLSRKLLNKYKKISINWYSMEDPRDKLIRGYISQDTLLTEQELLLKKNYIGLLSSEVEDFDIEFVNKSSSIKEIGAGFKKFKSKREENFNILIVDNIMKILPSSQGKRELDIDSEITREIDSWNIKTDNKESSVFLLHHFSKEALSNRNEFKGFEPNIGMMRGSGRYKDLSTHVLLFNAIYSHSNIMRLFKSPMIEHLLIVHVAKNRNGEKVTFKFFAYPSVNAFFLIN